MFDVIGFWAVATILSVYPIYIALRVVVRGVLSRLKKHMGWVSWQDYPGYSKDCYNAQPYPYGLQKFHDVLFRYKWVRFLRGVDIIASCAIVFCLLLSGTDSSLLGTTYIQRISMFSEHVSTVSGWFFAVVSGWFVFDKGLAIFAKFSALIQRGEK